LNNATSIIWFLPKIINICTIRNIELMESETTSNAHALNTMENIDFCCLRKENIMHSKFKTHMWSIFIVHPTKVPCKSNLFVIRVNLYCKY
jgi:hypothetical protein